MKVYSPWTLDHVLARSLSSDTLSQYTYLGSLQLDIPLDRMTDPFPVIEGSLHHHHWQPLIPTGLSSNPPARCTHCSLLQSHLMPVSVSDDRKANGNSLLPKSTNTDRTLLGWAHSVPLLGFANSFPEATSGQSAPLFQLWTGQGLPIEPDTNSRGIPNGRYHGKGMPGRTLQRLATYLTVP